MRPVVVITITGSANFVLNYLFDCIFTNLFHIIRPTYMAIVSNAIFSQYPFCCCGLLRMFLRALYTISVFIYLAVRIMYDMSGTLKYNI